MSEVPIVSARASVMVYDDVNKKWIPSGSTQGLSKVQIYQHTVNNTFRVVGRKLQDHEVVINCAVLKNLRYNQATPTFHQWRDSRHVYGLNFANKEDSESFSNAMLTALDTLNNANFRQPAAPMPPPTAPPSGHPMPQYQVPQQPHSNGSGPQDMQRGHSRTCSGGGPKEVGMPQIPQQQQPAYQPSHPPAPPAPPAAPPAPPAPPQPPAGPPAPPAPPAAPPAPPMPPEAPAAPAAPPAPPVPSAAPPAPPVPPSGGGGPPPPPPPPPPPSGSSGAGGGGGGSLADQLKAAKLKKAAAATDSPADSVGGAGAASKPPPSSGGSSGGGGGGDLMDALSKALQKRKTKTAQSDQARNDSPSPTPTSSAGPSHPGPSAVATSKPWEREQKQVTNGNRISNGAESPKFPRKRNPSLTGKENLPQASTGTGSSPSDLESLKQEILAEMRKEMNSMKQEILQAIRDSAR